MTPILHHDPRTRGIPLPLASLLMVFSLMVPGAFGQVITGLPPFGSFSGGPDVINDANLNAHLAIPVVDKGGRGMTFSYAFAYDSTVWSPKYSGGQNVWTPVSNWGWHGITEVAIGYVTYNSNTYSGQCYADFKLYNWSYTEYSNWAYFDPSGVVHGINLTLDSTLTFSGPSYCTPLPTLKPYSGSVVLADGSGLTFFATGLPSATVYTRSGVAINPPLINPAGSGNATNPNANVISTNGLTFTDTLGMAALTVSGSPPNPVNFKYYGAGGAQVTVVVKYTTKAVWTNFGCSGITEYAPSNKSLVSEVDLPDGTKYTFSYEPTPNHSGYVTGRLALITLPTSGQITYNYTGGSSGHITCTDGSTAGLDRTTPDGTWQYSRTQVSGSHWQTTLKDPQQDQTIMDFQGIYETKREVKDSGGTTQLTVDTCYNGASIPCTATSMSLPISNRTVQVTLPGLSPSKTYTTYDTYALPTELDEYAYGGVNFVRKTTLSYTGCGVTSPYVHDRPCTVKVYDGAGGLKAETDNTYDIKGNLLTEARSTGGTPATVSRSFTYSSTGVLQTATDFRGITTTYTNTSCSNSFPTTITLPLSLSRSINWNCYLGLPNSTADENSRSTGYSYDVMNRLTITSYPDGGSLQMSYTTATVRDIYTKVVGTTQRHDQIALDGLGRATTTSLVNDPDGQTYVDTHYDSLGRLYTVSNPYRGSSSGGDTYAYDALSRVTKVTHADTNHADASYGSGSQTCPSDTYGLGYPVLFTDESNKQRRTFADALGRVIEVDEPDSSGTLTVNTCYRYDVLGNLYQVVQGSETRTFNHDMLSRLTSAITPEAGTVSLYYTTSGGLLCSGAPSAVCRRTDARSITATYTYDALNRQTGTSYSNNNPTATAYTYDQTSCLGLSVSCYNKGRRTTMTDASGTTQWAYDAMGRVLREHRTISSVTKDITYTYNLDGSLATLTYPSGRVVTYTPSAVGRPLSAVDTANSINYALNATYAPQGAVAGVLIGYQSGGFGGITFAATYNNRLLPYTATATSSGGNALNLSFGYYANGNVQTITNNLNTARTQTYTYDNLNRVATGQSQATSGQYCWGESFGYDRYANLLSTTVTKCTAWPLSLSVNTNNQITNSGFTYDASGDMTSDGTYTYAWDARNRLQSAGGVTYTYDGDGKRVKKSSGTLYWNALGGTPLAETDASGNTPNEYIFFAGRIARRDSSGNVYYYFQDQVGTSKVIATSAGVVCYDADFFPYGQEMAYINSCPQNYKFTGLERDGETGLDHTLFRKYTSSLGRWLTPDRHRGNPFNPQSWNRYAYVLDNPCNLTDPLGLDCGFNIAVVDLANGLSDSQVAALKNELNGILTQAGVGAQFVQPGSADYTITVTPYSPPSFPSTYLGFTPFVPTGPQSPIAARQVANYGFVYASNVASLPFASSFTPTSYASALGAIAAHEFGHWALPLPTDSRAFTGIMGAPTNSLAQNPIPLQFTALQGQRLQGRCEALHGNNGSGGHGGGGGGGGGDNDQYVFVAGWGSGEGEGGSSSDSEGGSPTGASGGGGWEVCTSINGAASGCTAGC